jgi:hypothetical protein
MKIEIYFFEFLTFMKQSLINELFLLKIQFIFINNMFDFNQYFLPNKYFIHNYEKYILRI